MLKIEKDLVERQGYNPILNEVVTEHADYIIAPGNLYKIWNRMTSDSYFPPPVRTVFIPKKQGGERPLGIPTVGGRIAQGVVKDY